MGWPGYSPQLTGQASGTGLELVTENTMVILITREDFNRYMPLL